ncbi:hypothetical protein TSUD_141100 [Trifolium subterraneum]|uniref:Uncharacterized protein n=1 Tax=Trifolium subterraneum TaxID=3900 RepID=A0A2Z6PFW7_TRISU|nr:hypothetical protein TSUD_141100 [Trifolium subterraneum]
MCHPKIPFVSQEGLIVHTRWFVFQGSNEAEHEPRHVHHGDGVGNSSDESGSVKRCMCSPSQHPGSFRCRQHHGEYVWRGKTIK